MCIDARSMSSRFAVYARPMVVACVFVARLMLARLGRASNSRPMRIVAMLAMRVSMHDRCVFDICSSQKRSLKHRGVMIARRLFDSCASLVRRVVDDRAILARCCFRIQIVTARVSNMSH